MKTIRLLVLASALLFTGASCAPQQTAAIKPVRLEYWRAADAADTLADVIADYQKLHANVTIAYTQMRAEDYEQKLLEALAENRGPDMFSIPNAWLKAWQKKLLPLPKETVIPTQVVNTQNKIAIVNQKSASITQRQLTSDFVETVAKDVVILDPFDQNNPDVKLENRIYGLPLSVDTLAMYVNKDLLAQARFDKPAATWRQLQEQASAMTVKDDSGKITQSGAAIGSGGNVRHAPELLMTIMMQNGAVLADESGYPHFGEWPPGETSSEFPPGTEALIFIQSFSAKGGRNQTWDAGMPDSLDAFVTGKTAIYFGYPQDAQEIRTRAPRLNFQVAPMPQIRPEAPAGLAYYPVEVVSRKTANLNEAWDFIQFLSRSEEAAKFLAKAKRPTALRSLIGGQISDADTGAFASQILTAKSWYRGYDYARVQRAFRTMIDTLPPPEKPDYRPIIEYGLSEVSQTMRPPQ